MSADQLAEIHRLIDAAVRYQDRRYGSFGSDVAGVRLALACLQDELAEALDAWRTERRSPHWGATGSEVMDVVAVAVRLLRDIGVGVIE
jgi:NTP pyrophosphatase (non-canonical NTP hydrolase)